MIPIRDHNPPRRTAYVTHALIVLNVAIFLYMFFVSSEDLGVLIERFAFRPAEFLAGHGGRTIITAMFIHGSLGHLFGNMLFLNIFGDNLEDRLGHVKYLLYYLFCGVAGFLAQTFLDPTTSLPMLGASGAIAGVMGGYLVLFPTQPIEVLFFFGILPFRGTLPAFLMLFYWIGAQLLLGFGSLALPVETGVAYLAHVGGFFAGVVLILLSRDRLQS